MASQLSFSGYSKHDLYNDLKNALIRKKYERACCLSAELACSKNETLNLVNFFIQYTAECIPTRN